MATIAIDVTTIMHALVNVEEELSAKVVGGQNVTQRMCFEWIGKHRDDLKKITGLKAKVSKYADVLNKFLTDNKFDPMFEKLDTESQLGVVSILDKLVEWLNGPGEKITIYTEDGKKDGFSLPVSGVTVYKTSANEDCFVAKLHTKTDDILWVCTGYWGEKLDGIDIATVAFDVMGSKLEVDEQYEGIHIPMVDFDIKPDISWVCGMSVGVFVVEQAIQQFKMRMDETGARVKVATGMTLRKCASFEPQPLIIDKPFYGWWTQKGMEHLPMAVFYADYDCWKKSSDSLEDL